MENRRFKHGTEIRFKLTAGTEVLEDTVMPLDQLDGHLTVCGVMYNRLAVSGGVSWWNPSTGYAVAKPKWSIDTVNPSDELTGDQLCDCSKCVPPTQICLECRNAFDDNPGKDICKTCEDWLVTRIDQSADT
jgi:hypothetical protein